MFDFVFLFLLATVTLVLILLALAGGIYAVVMTRRGYAITPSGRLVRRAGRLVDRRGVVDERVERYLDERLGERRSVAPGGVVEERGAGKEGDRRECAGNS